MEGKILIKILMGGSPCTHWSVAQKNNRETEPEGLGWELFKNYLIAKEKYKPDYFLYENNKSAAQPIKDQISKELGVDLQYINSALVSAQNRQRFYAHNIPNVLQPEDRGILLRDILESGASEREKTYPLHANYYKLEYQKWYDRRFSADKNKQQHDYIFEPVCVAQRGRYIGENGNIEQHYEAREDGKTNVLTTVSKDNMIAEPVCLRYERTEDGKKFRKQYENHEIHHGFNEMRNLQPRLDGKSNTVTTVLNDNMIAEPVIYQIPHGFNEGGIKYDKSPTLTANGSWQTNNFITESVRIGSIGSDSQAHRVYSVFGKSINIVANSGGQGAKTGLYAIPVDKSFKGWSIYTVENGLIEINGKQHKIKLPDGYYIIRKLTVLECKRLQTVPDEYIMPCSDTQNYKMLGNGWTVDVIAHILSHIPNIQNEPIEVLSMYDGMSCGHIALDKIGANITRYYAIEIDKYAIKTTMANYPNTIQLGDAFQVREDNWSLPI